MKNPTKTVNHPTSTGNVTTATRQRSIRAITRSLAGRLRRITARIKARIKTRITQVVRIITTAASTLIDTAANALHRLATRRGIASASSALITSTQVIGHLARHALKATGARSNRWTQGSWIAGAITVVLIAALTVGLLLTRHQHLEPADPTGRDVTGYVATGYVTAGNDTRGQSTPGPHQPHSGTAPEPGIPTPGQTTHLIVDLSWSR